MTKQVRTMVIDAGFAVSSMFVVTSSAFAQIAPPPQPVPYCV